MLCFKLTGLYVLTTCACFVLESTVDSLVACNVLVQTLVFQALQYPLRSVPVLRLNILKVTPECALDIMLLSLSTQSTRAFGW